MILGKIFKTGHVTLTTPIFGVFCHDCICSRSRDMVGARRNLNGSRDLDHAPFNDSLSSMGLNLLRSIHMPNLTSLCPPATKI